MEVFEGKEVREAALDGEGKCVRWRNQKARDFTHFLTHKFTLLSTFESQVALEWFTLGRPLSPDIL